MTKPNMLNSTISAQDSIVPSPAPPQRLLPPTRRPHLFLEDVERPKETIRRIHDALLPFSTPCKTPVRRLLPGSDGEDRTLWLISSGSLEVSRIHDDLTIAVSEGPLVTGLQEMFAPFERHNFTVSRGAVISALPGSQARKVITEEGLWESVGEVLAYYMRMMTYRDEHLVSSSSYTAIRAKLIEYMAHREVLIRNRTGIVAYIQSTTLLSRSLIYNVLSVLVRCGYIRLNRGKLEEIFHLPERY